MFNAAPWYLLWRPATRGEGIDPQVLKDFQATGLTPQNWQTLPGQSRHLGGAGRPANQRETSNRFRHKRNYGGRTKIQQTGVLGQRQLSTGGKPGYPGYWRGFGNGRVV